MWYPPIGVLTVLLVGIIVSLLTHSFDSNRVDRKLIIPIGDGLCCCIPKRIRQWLGCSVNDENDFDNRVRTKLFEAILIDCYVLFLEK